MSSVVRSLLPMAIAIRLDHNVDASGSCVYWPRIIIFHSFLIFSPTFITIMDTAGELVCLPGSWLSIYLFLSSYLFCCNLPSLYITHT